MSTFTASRPAERSVPLSALDWSLVALSQSHAGHAAGPILPCPLCFQPALDLVATTRTSISLLGTPVSTVETTRQAAA